MGLPPKTLPGSSSKNQRTNKNLEFGWREVENTHFERSPENPHNRSLTDKGKDCTNRTA